MIKDDDEATSNAYEAARSFILPPLAVIFDAFIGSFAGDVNFPNRKLSGSGLESFLRSVNVPGIDIHPVTLRVVQGFLNDHLYTSETALRHCFKKEVTEYLLSKLKLPGGRGLEVPPRDMPLSCKRKIILHAGYD